MHTVHACTCICQLSTDSETIMLLSVRVLECACVFQNPTLCEPDGVPVFDSPWWGGPEGCGLLLIALVVNGRNDCFSWRSRFLGDRPTPPQHYRLSMITATTYQRAIKMKSDSQTTPTRGPSCCGGVAPLHPLAPWFQVKTRQLQTLLSIQTSSEAYCQYPAVRDVAKSHGRRGVNIMCMVHQKMAYLGMLLKLPYLPGMQQFFSMVPEPSLYLHVPQVTCVLVSPLCSVSEWVR